MYAHRLIILKYTYFINALAYAVLCLKCSVMLVFQIKKKYYSFKTNNLDY